MAIPQNSDNITHTEVRSLFYLVKRHQLDDSIPQPQEDNVTTSFLARQSVVHAL
jgi:hypothetical protein